MKLKEKLVEVSKAIEYLKKDKTNKMQGYNYLSEAKIKEVIKKQFEQQGIIFNYSTRSVREYEISQTHKGTKQFCTIAEGSYSFMDIESEEVIKGHWFGSGSDTGDKGLYKAITGGIKYVLNTNFLIPSGDDPENDNGVNGKDKKTKPQNQPTGKSNAKYQKLVTDKQIKRLYAMEREAGLDPQKTDDYIKQKYQVDSKKELTMVQIDEIFKGLDKKIEAKKIADEFEESEQGKLKV